MQQIKHSASYNTQYKIFYYIKNLQLGYVQYVHFGLEITDISTYQFVNT
jgi:hypothetical protein